MSDDSPSTPTPEGKSGGSGLADLFASLPHAVLFKRATTWDLTTVEPTEAERAKLPEGVSARVARYLVWRRGMMYLALAAGLVSAVFALIALIGDLSDASDFQHGSGVMSLLALMGFGSRIVLLVFVLLCIGKWTDAGWTRRRLRIGWAVALLTPLGIALVPISAIVLGDAQANQVGVKDLIGLIAGTQMFIMALPALLSLFPGMLRACMTVKTAFPGRGVAPTVGAGLTPIYGIFLLVVVTPVQQIVSSFLFFVGVMLFVAGPFAYARNTVPLLRPMSFEQASQGVGKARVSMRWFQVPGIFLIAVALLSKKVFGAHVFGFDEKSMFGFWKLLDFAPWFVVMVSTYTVVAADGLIQAMAASDVRADEDREKEAWHADSAPLAETAALLGPIGFLAKQAAPSDPDEGPAANDA